MGYRTFTLADFSNIVEIKSDWRMNRIEELLTLVINQEIQSHRQQKVLIGFFFDKKTQKDIAEELDITRSSVKEYISRGKVMLGRIMEKEIKILYDCDYMKII